MIDPDKPHQQFEAKEPFYTYGRELAEELIGDGYLLITEIFQIEPVITESGVESFGVNGSDLVDNQGAALDVAAYLPSILAMRAGYEWQGLSDDPEECDTARLSLWKGLKEAFEDRELARRVNLHSPNEDWC